jgi:predicted Rossmann fold nucleotide-binding protein DprA/Smf involved in DNA uptake
MEGEAGDRPEPGETGKIRAPVSRSGSFFEPYSHICHVLIESGKIMVTMNKNNAISGT